MGKEWLGLLPMLAAACLILGYIAMHWKIDHPGKSLIASIYLWMVGIIVRMVVAVVSKVMWPFRSVYNRK